MRLFAIAIISFLLGLPLQAQELSCTVRVNHSQIQGTNNGVFDALEKAIADFMNNQTWTDLQYSKEERINCTLTFTIKQYKADENRFTGELLFQVSRPVFNSTYNSTIFSRNDTEISFTYAEGNPLEYNENYIDDNLTAILAYYAYLFIGMDLDTFSPKGGTEVLHRVERIVSDAQNFSEPGWKAFGNTKNRHAIINDYMESSMEPFRQLMYKYHRQGLDEMATNVDRGRTAITESIEMLKEAYDNRPLSMLPQIFTDFKRDELVNIYRGHGNSKEKDSVYEILLKINATQNNEWKKIQK
ncbi:MAG: DUF4835 family protein [Bacteroidaceae bacterium]|nr:DUF4835 family protein [Bacteroidaceae bacterium]